MIQESKNIVLQEKINRYWGYVEVLFENGEIVCSDCGGELSLKELEDNYIEPICDRCVWALKH